MEAIVSRYLQAVKFWLPSGQQEDIAAELAEDIASKIEERERAHGRKLEESEIGAILRQIGSPVLVASRYRPQRSLIGPVWFPVYAFVMRMLALCYLLPWLLVLVGLAMWHHRGLDAVNAILSGLGTFWLVAVSSTAAVTSIFAALERGEAGARLLDRWDPCKLPAVTVFDPLRIKRSASVAEVAVNLAIAFWWLDSGLFRSVFAAQGIHVELSPAWGRFYWAFLLVALANVALAGANLLLPWWTRARAYLRFALDGAGAGSFCWLLKAHVLIGVVMPNMPAATAAGWVEAINIGLARSFPFIVLISVLVVALADVPRLLRFDAGKGGGRPRTFSLSA